MRFSMLVFLLAGLAVSHAVDPTITTRLVELIQKKQYDAFAKELSKEGMDVNQPTPKGITPIIEAVKTKDIKYVDALIQFGAQVAVKEMGSEITPIYVAFQIGVVDIARVLLAHGADPDVVAKNGKAAKDVAAGPACKDLYASWKKDGAIAFEDVPGTWSRVKEDGKEYWFNKITKEGRWNMPPSCGWQRMEVMSGPAQYLNYVTGQTIYRTPPALCWRKVRAQGQEVWYNWVINTTQQDQPDEMPQYLIDEASNTMNIRWYNKRTQEWSWEDPKAKSHWKPVTDEADGKTYYFNIVTGESQWELPDEMAWSKHEHEGSFYWHNAQTGENTWDEPHHESWEVHDSDL